VPPQAKPVIVRLDPDNKSMDASTNPTARSVGPVASPTKPKPSSQNNHAPHRTTVQGYEQPEAWDLGTDMEEPGEDLPEEEPRFRQPPGPITPGAEENHSMAEGLDRDDARTHKILTQMFADSRNTEAVDSPRPPHQPVDINHGLVDLLEDDKRILGNIKEMKKAEYPKLFDIAVIIWEFEQRKEKLEYEGSEEAVLEELGRDASPTL